MILQNSLWSPCAHSRVASCRRVPTWCVLRANNPNWAVSCCFRRPLLLRRPLDQQPFLRAGFAKMIVAMRRPHSQTRKARGDRVGRALPPRDRGPRVCRQRERDLLGLIAAGGGGRGAGGLVA